MNSTLSDSFKDNNFVQEFEEFYRKDASKIVIVISVFLVNLISSLLMYAIVLYERFGADQKKNFDQQTCVHDLLEWHNRCSDIFCVGFHYVCVCSFHNIHMFVF
jgi:hypothetical protein